MKALLVLCVLDVDVDVDVNVVVLSHPWHAITTTTTFTKSGTPYDEMLLPVAMHAQDERWQKKCFPVGYIHASIRTKSPDGV